jgi:cysteinyl-tRNA synthetase
MKIYNTLTKKQEEFKAIKDKEVGLYTCGPTVYLRAHIGNFRTYILEDFLKKALNFLGYKVKHVMNITDVGHLTSDSDEGDDKMELGAKREGKTAWEIAEYYTNLFFKDFDELNCMRPNISCKATEHIKDMIELISRLEKNGYTYKISDGIYFDTSKFKNYGELVGKAHIEGLKAGARIEFNGEKRNITDFALWKFSPKDANRQMEWQSPWGIGFPGWHIECSAMSMKYLGETFDIHCGGVDHIAIHHTNEIAQAEGATGKKFVNYWMHCEFLTLGGDVKMSKSSGNFLTIETIKEKGFSPLDYRYFCSQAHYRKQLEFSFKALESAKNSLRNLRNSAQEIAAKAGEIKEDRDLKYYRAFIKALEDDLNIPLAVGALWEMIRDNSISPQIKLWALYEFDKVLSFDILKSEKLEIPDEINELITKRSEAKKNKDYKKADEIREMIKTKGYMIEDTANGVKVKKV